MLRACPICKTISDSASNPEFPFCSHRCRERDLGNWAAEKYVVSEPIFDEDVEDVLEDLDDTPEPNDAHH